MSMLICPLCGKQSSLRLFDPSDFDDDIIAIEKRGLGRGKGFVEVSRFSMMGTRHPVLSLIKDRVLTMAKLLDIRDEFREDTHRDELGVEALKVQLELQSRHNMLLTSFNDRTRELNGLNNEIEALKVMVEELESERDVLRSRLEELQVEDDEDDECTDCSVANELCTYIETVVRGVEWSYDPEDHDSTECLKERVHYLLGEYEVITIE